MKAYAVRTERFIAIVFAPLAMFAACLGLAAWSMYADR